MGDLKVKKIKNNKSKFSALKTCIIFFITVTIIFVIARYIADENFRNSFDTHILKKELSESNLSTIEINSDTNPYIYSYDKYITVLSKNKFLEYTSDGNIHASLDVNISVPLIDSDGSYLVLAEKEGQKLYLISGNNILWQDNIEGKISKVRVNKNGYVSIIITNTTYKSVIVVYRTDGTELFRRYLASNYALCTDISDNNKYLAIGEVDYSGTIINSYVNVISIQLAQSNPNNSIVNTYQSESGEIITNINYFDKDSAMCMFNSYIQKVTSTNNERIYDVNTNDLFIDINLDNNIGIVRKQSSGMFSYEYELAIRSLNNNESLYILDKDVPKNIIVKHNLIALCFGNELKIVNTNAWLLKNYTSSKEIKNIVLGDSIAGIIYKNKIEIINL